MLTEWKCPVLIPSPDSWRQLLQTVRLADVLDIGVIAVLLYLAFGWIRQRRWRPVGVALGGALLLYVLAQRFNMYLTAMLFQAGFTAILLALVVIFQDDIRQLCERLAAWRWRSGESDSRTSEAFLDLLTEGACHLADNRIGALIVIEGRETVERHVRGGVPVDGCLSLSLLYSIFEPSSPGHDGAVLIQGQRVSKFGVHLPLSKNLAELGTHGTRHAAGLGLAERCDSLVLIISEEEGSVSIAERGTLRKIEPGELRDRVARAWKAGHERPNAGSRGARLWRDGAWKVGAVAVAALLWLLLAYRIETVQRTFIVPIEYRDIPSGCAVAEPHPTRAQVTVSGSERDFAQLDPAKIAVSINVSRLASRSPQLFRTREHLQFSAHLSVRDVQPPQVLVGLDCSAAAANDTR